MIFIFKGDVSVAKEAVRWLNNYVSINEVDNLNPTYASFLNDTVLWKAKNAIWTVLAKPKLKTIEVHIEGDFMNHEHDFKFTKGWKEIKLPQTFSVKNIEMLLWCKNKKSKYGYHIVRNQSTPISIRFESKEDAMEFIMLWM